METEERNVLISLFLACFNLPTILPLAKSNKVAQKESWRKEHTPPLYLLWYDKEQSRERVRTGLKSNWIKDRP